MSFVPKFRLYDSTGLVLQYTFPLVQDCNYPSSPRRGVTIEGTRGKGGVIIDGGEAMWEINLVGYIFADDYEALTDLIDALETAVIAHTPYILKIDKDSGTQYEYKVKRINAVQYPIDNGQRNKYQEYRISFMSNSW